MTPSSKTYTPALGFRALTPLYDLAISGFTREGRWRPSLVRRVAPRPHERIVDVGCGTGTLTHAFNGQGILPSLMRDAGFHDVEEVEVIVTPSGSISIYSGLVPALDAHSNAGHRKDYSHE